MVVALTLGLLAGLPALQGGSEGAGALHGQTPMAGDPGPSALSLEEALELARQNNPDFRLQQRQIESVERQRRQARGDFLPSMNVSNSYGYQASGERRVESVVIGDDPDVLSSSYSLSMSYSLNGQTLLRPGQVRAQMAEVQAQVEGAGSGLRAEVTDSYLAVLQADAQLEQALNELERVELNLRQARAQVEVGAATPLDVRRAEVQVGQAEVQVVQSENSALGTRLALGRLLAVDLPEDVEMVTSFELFDPEIDVDGLLDRAYETNPVLRASRRSVESAQVGVRSARTQYLPNLSLSAGISGSVFQARTLDPLFDNALSSLSSQYSSCREDNRLRELLGDPPRDCSQFNPEIPEVEEAAREQVRNQEQGWPFSYRRQPLSMSLSLSIPIFTGYSRSNAVEEARLSERNAREQVRSEELRLNSEVRTAARTVQTARRTVELQERIRETATEELRLAQERFRLGLASSIEVADAQANLSQAERDEINAVYQFFQSFAALEALVGEPLR